MKFAFMQNPFTQIPFFTWIYNSFIISHLLEWLKVRQIKSGIRVNFDQCARLRQAWESQTEFYSFFAVSTFNDPFRNLSLVRNSEMVLHLILLRPFKYFCSTGVFSSYRCTIVRQCYRRNWDGLGLCLSLCPLMK